MDRDPKVLTSMHNLRRRSRRYSSRYNCILVRSEFEQSVRESAEVCGGVIDLHTAMWPQALALFKTNQNVSMDKRDEILTNEGGYSLRYLRGRSQLQSRKASGKSI